MDPNEVCVSTGFDGRAGTVNDGGLRSGPSPMLQVVGWCWWTWRSNAEVQMWSDGI